MADIKKFVGQEALSTLVDQVKAEDAKVLAAAKAHAEGLSSNYDAAGSAATAKSEAVAAAEEKVNALANGQVATNTAAIETLNGTGEGSVSKAVGDAKTELQGKIDEEAARAKGEEARIEGLAKTAQDEVDALELVVAEKAAQSDLDELAELVGTLPEGTSAATVVEYVNVKTAGIATDAALEELQNQLNGVQSSVSTLSSTHATDKTALEGAIALKADQSDLEAVSAVANAAATQTALTEEINRAKGEEARIEGLVTAEAAARAEADEALDERLVKVETFFETAEGETISEAMDTLVEIQKYITEDGAAADQMVKDIAANAKAIEDHLATDHDFASADATLKAELEGEISAKADASVVTELSGKMTTAEGKITANEEAITALQGVDTTLSGRIDALEEAVGESGSIAEDIATAKQEAIDAAASAADTKDAEILKQAKEYADTEDAKIEERVGALETASATHALASDVTTLSGKVSTLESEMDAVEAKASANESSIGTINTELAKKAAQTDLESAVARIAVNEGAIVTINETLADKAEAEALEAAVARIAANETAIAANTSAINSFSEISASDVQALFA